MSLIKWLHKFKQVKSTKLNNPEMLQCISYFKNNKKVANYLDKAIDSVDEVVLGHEDFVKVGEFAVFCPKIGKYAMVPIKRSIDDYIDSDWEC